MLSSALRANEVGDKNEIGLASLCCDDICPLECLWAVAEWVVDVHDGLRCSGIAGDI